MRQWKTFDHGGKKADENTLPRRRDDFSALPERDLLKPLIFGSGKDGTRRFDVARRVSESKARGHIELCEHLAENFSQNSVIKILPTFSRLADAGMSAMDLVAKALQNESRVALSDIAAEPSAKSVCKELTDAARLWRKNEGVHLPHIERANRFAAAMVRSEAVECLGALLQYHELHGGGLRWFVLRKGWVAPRTPPRVGSSRYRFRLWSLCRLAAQCGVLRSMPPALRHDIEEEEDENS